MYEAGKIDDSAQEKYERWKDFALRMARTCFPQRQNPDTTWIVMEVEGLFESTFLKKDAHLIKSWDDAPIYPCDRISDWEDFLWIEAYQYATPKQQKLYDELDERGREEELDSLKEKIVERWSNPVHCCIRAGLDLAFEPSAGVLGFTVGDLCKMYPERIPNWLSEWVSLQATNLRDEGKQVAELNQLSENTQLWF